MYFSKYRYLKINHYYLFFCYCLFINLLNRKLYHLGFYKLYIIYTFRLDLRYFLNIPKKDTKFINILKNKFYKKNFSFIEIGSGQGYLSAQILSDFKNAKIFAFDPRKDLFNRFKKIEKKLKNFKFFNSIISNKKKITNFYIYNDKNLSSMYKLKPKKYSNTKHYNLNRNKLMEIKKYKTYPLSYFSKNFSENLVLSIDVQGNEYEVLNSCKYFFRKKNIKVIIVEVIKDSKYLNKSNPVINFLKKMNFKIHNIIPGHKVNNIITEYDYIFLHKEF